MLSQELILMTRFVQNCLLTILACSMILSAIACGGGGSSTAQPTPLPTPAPGDFSVTAATSSFTASPGSHVGSVIVNISASGGFNKALTVTATVPSGVTCLPSCSLGIPAPSATLFSFDVGSGVNLGSYTINISASEAGRSHSASIALTIQAAPPVVPNRSAFVRTDDSPTDIALDRVRHLAYTANRRLNRVEIISLPDASIIGSISIPKPVGLDITLDNNSLYVAAEVQKLFRVDLNLRQVVEEIPYSSPPGLDAPFTGQPITLANGKVLVRTGCGRINACTTETDLVEYDPNTHSFTALQPPNINTLVGQITRSVDHSKVLIAGSDSGGHLALFDSATNSFIAQDKGTLFGSAVFGMAINPDATRFAVTAGCCQLAIFDANLNQVFTRTNNSDFIENNLLYSLDGSRLYLSADPTSNRDPIIRVLETGAFTEVGQVPDLRLDGFPFRPLIHALTDDGFILGSAERGMSLVDSTAMVPQLPSLAPLPSFEFLGSLQPSHVNVGSRSTSMGASHMEFTPEVLFGNQPAINANFVSEAQVDLTAPPSLAQGPVNVKSLFPGGYFTIAPDAYTYGPQGLFVKPDSGSTEGGTLTSILGYGLNYSAAQISVTVGGLPASAVATKATLGRSPFSFPVQVVSFIAPPVSSAGDTNIVITTPDGNITMPYHYVSRTSLPILDAQQLVLDEVRNRLYSSDATNNAVDIVNLSNGNLSLVPLGALPVGIALMPDGSRILTANFAQKTVSLINPDNTANITTVNVDTGDTLNVPQPVTVAGLAGNKAFVGMGSITVIGCVGVLREIDLATLAVTTRTPPQGACVGSNFQMVASGDGTRAYIGPFLWENSTDSFSLPTQSIVPGGTIRAASLNGNVFASHRALYDNRLRMSSVADWPELLECLGCTVAGAKLHSSGSLLYIAFVEALPSDADHLEIFDVHKGTLLRTIDIPEKWGDALDVLALDKSGSRIFGVTQAGVIEFQLGSVPLSLGQILPSSGTIGTAVVFNGSGLLPGATVSIGGHAATATFIDDTKIQVIVPSLVPGTYGVRITNPNGETYSLDATFTVN
jgi:hypothetical protein